LTLYETLFLADITVATLFFIIVSLLSQLAAFGQAISRREYLYLLVLLIGSNLALVTVMLLDHIYNPLDAGLWLPIVISLLVMASIGVTFWRGYKLLLLVTSIRKDGA